MKRNEDSLSDLWDSIKSTNIHIIGVPEEERKKGPEKIFEDIITENLPNMRKETVTQFRKQREKLIQDNPKVEHAKTFGKIERQRENIKSNKGKAANNIQEREVGSKTIIVVDYYTQLMSMDRSSRQKSINTGLK